MRRRSIVLFAAVQLALAGCVSSNPGYCVDSTLCNDSDGIPGWGADLTGSNQDLAQSSDDQGSSMQDMSMAPLDLNKMGPYSFIRFDRKVMIGRSNIDISVIGPSDDGKELTKRGAPLPWVLLSPGFQTDHKQYQSYGDRLASYGIVTVLQKSPSEFNHASYRDETVQLINWLLNPVGMGADRLAGRLDRDRLGLVGHSLGGKISFLVAESDSRVKALLGIDPVDQRDPTALSGIAKLKLPTGVPVGYLGETVSKMGGMPCAPASANYEVLYKAGPSPAFSITFIGAAHMDFVDNPATCWNCGFCTGGTAPKDRTNSLAIKYTTAYFLSTIGGERRALDTLSGVQFQKDVAAGSVSREAK